MLERVYIKNNLSFGEVDLRFGAGLNVFTGSSGAGKSILMNAILAVFALKDSDAGLIEADVNSEFEMDEFGLQNETPNNFRLVKDRSVRYFINSQAVSKKNLNLIVDGYVKFLGSKDSGEINSANLLALLDACACKKSGSHGQNLAKFKEAFEQFIAVQKELALINEQERKIEELKEFARFEIEKIERVSPKIGEYDELLQIKKKLSKKDKIEELWAQAEQIFAFERSATEALKLSGFESDFFEEAMNELRLKRESLSLDELENIDIEQILDRIEALSALNRRYGSVEEALATLEARKKELAHYEQIGFEKSKLQSEFEILENRTNELAGAISAARKSEKDALERLINSYLSELYMNGVRLEFKEAELNERGRDEIGTSIDKTDFKSLSSGETNRLRLAFIAASLDLTNEGGGILILDEIDSNLSGKEAMSIANVLVKISKFYQIFAISHQPQLSSKAAAHFLVSKESGASSVRLLGEEEKITELARMISGKTITAEALEFAKKLRLS